MYFVKKVLCVCSVSGTRDGHVDTHIPYLDCPLYSMLTGLTRTEGHTIQGHTLDTPTRTLNT